MTNSLLCGFCVRNSFLILHISQEKALGWNGHAGTATVFLTYDLTETVNGEFAKADVEEGTYYGTYHIA